MFRGSRSTAAISARGLAPVRGAFAPVGARRSSTARGPFVPARTTVPDAGHAACFDTHGRNDSANCITQRADRRRPRQCSILSQRFPSRPTDRLLPARAGLTTQATLTSSRNRSRQSEHDAVHLRWPASRARKAMTAAWVWLMSGLAKIDVRCSPRAAHPTKQPSSCSTIIASQPFA